MHAFFFLFMIYLSILSTITQVFSRPSSALHPNSTLLYPTIRDAQYRISTARLTINTQTRKMITKFAQTLGVSLDLGRPDHARVREVKSALAGLVAVEAYWNRLGIPNGELVRSDRVARLVQHLVEVVHRWPGLLVDSFALESIESVIITIQPIRFELREQQPQASPGGLLHKCVQWAVDFNRRLVVQVTENRKSLDPVRVALKRFNTSLTLYIQGVKDYWNSDFPVFLFRRSVCRFAIRNVEHRVAIYLKPPMSYHEKVFWVLVSFGQTCLWQVPLMAIFGCLIYISLMNKKKKEDKERSGQVGGATSSANTTTQPMTTTTPV